MPRMVRCSIIQASNAVPATEPLAAQKKAMVEKHVGLIRQAAKQGAQIVCLQEIFNGPYFCAEQEAKWYEMTEPVPDGPDRDADARAGERTAHRDGCAGVRSGAGGNFLQHRGGDRERRHRIWANIARRIFRM